MDFGKRKKHKKTSLKALDLYLGKAKKTAYKSLSSFGSVITDMLCPYDDTVKERLKGKKEYISGCAFNFIISFLVTLSRISGGIYPFGISVLCSFTSSKYAYFILSGNLLGAVLSQGSPLIRLTSYFLLFTLRKTFTAGKFNEKAIIRIIYACSFSLFTEAACIAGSGISASDIFSIISCCCICASSVYIFFAFFSTSAKVAKSSLYTLALYCIFACTVNTASSFSPFGIDLSLIYAGVLVLYFSKAKGPVFGCVSGFIMGFAGTNPLYSMPLGLSGLICGYLFTKSFIIASIGFTAACSLCALYLLGFEMLSRFFPYCATSSLIFLIIGSKTPKLFLDSVNTKAPAPVPSAPFKDTSFEKVSDSLSGLSGILYKFAEHMKSPSHSETGDIFDNAFNEICSHCSMNGMCYAKRECSFEKVREDTIEALRSSILKEEKLSALLLHKCIRTRELCDYINRHYSELRFLTAKSNRTGTVACLYNSMSRLIRSTEKEEWAKNTRDTRLEGMISACLNKIGVEFTGVICKGSRTKQISVYGIRADKIPCSAKDLAAYLSKQCSVKLSPPVFDLTGGAQMVMKLERGEIIGCEYARSCASKKGEDICGDTVTFFDSDAGYFYSILSDGMGSGKAAAATSRLSCVFLEKLLRASTKKNVCLELLNNLLLSKNDETFAGIDLLEIDKLNSSACFIKAGAAPSFILRGMKLYKIRSETPPVGIIHAFSAESTSFSLEKGDVIIMLSDGITGSDNEDRWLSELIRIDTKDEPALLASTLIERAKQLTSESDDMSAVVIKII